MNPTSFPLPSTGRGTRDETEYPAIPENFEQMPGEADRAMTEIPEDVEEYAKRMMRETMEEMLSEPGYMQLAKARSLHMSPEMMAAFQPNSTTSRDESNFTTQSQLPLPSEAFKRSMREQVEILTNDPHMVDLAKSTVLGLTPLSPLYTLTEGFRYPPSHPHLRVPNIIPVHQCNCSNCAGLQHQNHSPLPSFAPQGTAIHKPESRCLCTLHVDSNPGQSSRSNSHEPRNPDYMGIGNVEEATMVDSYPSWSGTPRELQHDTNASQSSRFNPHELRYPQEMGIGNVEEATMYASYPSGSGAPRELQQGQQVRRSQGRSAPRDLSGKWYY
ncbi:hypothetical protein PGTUg99_036886 [Puccinia graminis f. sp. tritici]|uniref:Uncharacterized protein n=1 Tax=Puccinia graminis f. sp. tritici TaxID=56615 RepID=A0A5B0LWC5_PUCGR|nr:hypothetical protein PGTUg99_036886 [Puccinia graminis f. sp. tritici]